MTIIATFTKKTKRGLLQRKKLGQTIEITDKNLRVHNAVVIIRDKALMLIGVIHAIGRKAINMQNNHPILDIDWGIIPIAAYRGVYIAKLPNGRYLIWGREVDTPEEVDKIIDDSLLSLMKSIKNGNSY